MQMQDIRDHAILGTAHVQMLASMPNLKTLVVYSLRPDSPVFTPPNGGRPCAWRDLSIVNFNGNLVELSRLPLADIKTLHLGSALDGSQRAFKWDLGSAADSPESVSELAGRIRSLFQVLARTHSYNPHERSMRLLWNHIPDQPFLPIIAATAQLRILDLNLCRWNMGAAVVQTLAEAQPRLQKLKMTSCHTSSATWAAMPRLTCLTTLHIASAQPMSFLDEDYRQLALFASDRDRELTLTVNMSEFEAFKRTVMGRRQALGRETAQLKIYNAPTPD